MNGVVRHQHEEGDEPRLRPPLRLQIKGLIHSRIKVNNIENLMQVNIRQLGEKSSSSKKEKQVSGTDGHCYIEMERKRVGGGGLK